MDMIPFPASLVDGGHLRVMTGNQIKVWIALVRHVDSNGKTSLSLGQIELITGLTRPTVIDSIRALRDMGHVVKTAGDCRTASTYRINWTRCLFPEPQSQTLTPSLRGNNKARP